MSDKQTLQALFVKHGYTDFRWIDPKDVVVSQWVRMKCMFGCGDFGRNVPFSLTHNTDFPYTLLRRKPYPEHHYSIFEQ